MAEVEKEINKTKASKYQRGYDKGFEAGNKIKRLKISLILKDISHNFQRTQDEFLKEVENKLLLIKNDMAKQFENSIKKMELLETAEKIDRRYIFKTQNRRKE